ncbi:MULTISPECIES: DinB family protein [unclassified Micromonospora]|uniref:DinB family protein n=1 Tax=unclassified Micromonospora TaxID=2617518 RepID=UPI001C2137C1|nr:MULTISPECIES: DinB family protein [unclassified Micromonospora]MBU8860846.1 DinB family protein [Micromonospora sp. WMMB482]MDM4780388.1 DinB family protein [Micromonospora sp. b486]
MTGTTTTPATLDAERADLLAELADARNMLTNTVRGLTDEQAGQKPTVSALCLGGLIKHVASTEESWLRFVVEGPSAMSFALPEGVTWSDFMSGQARELPQWAVDRERDFQMLPEDTLPAILDRYARVAARTEEIVAAVEDLSATWPVPDAPWNEPGSVRSIRRVLIHVIAETTQHAGHADILRESIDGQTTT